MGIESLEKEQTEDVVDEEREEEVQGDQGRDCSAKVSEVADEEEVFEQISLGNDQEGRSFL